jgi:hypothetical protein
MAGKRKVALTLRRYSKDKIASALRGGLTLDWRNIIGVTAFTVVVLIAALLIFNPVTLLVAIMWISSVIDPKNAI